MNNNFLLEITDAGGRIHRDPKVIDEKKDLPNCFLNPDLSKFQGISPSYFKVEDGKIAVIPKHDRSIVSATAHFSKAYDGTVHVKKALEDATKELTSDMYERIQRLEHCLDIVNQELAKQNRAMAYNKDLNSTLFVKLREKMDQNYKMTKMLFCIFLLVIIVLKFI